MTVCSIMSVPNENWKRTACSPSKWRIVLVRRVHSRNIVYDIMTSHSSCYCHLIVSCAGGSFCIQICMLCKAQNQWMVVMVTLQMRLGVCMLIDDGYSTEGRDEKIQGYTYVVLETT